MSEKIVQFNEEIIKGQIKERLLFHLMDNNDTKSCAISAKNAIIR